jgi:hypothetical protein
MLGGGTLFDEIRLERVAVGLIRVHAGRLAEVFSQQRRRGWSCSELYREFPLP